MLNIRQEQIESFEQVMSMSFENEMVAHSKEFSPRLCEVLGDEQVRFVVRSAIKRAGEYGFTNRGPIRLFIEIMFLRGSAFDTDPQYPILGEILRSPEEQMQRAQRIYEESLDYYENVSGSGAVNVHKALRELSNIVRHCLTFSSNTFDTEILDEMTHVFPQKILYIGEQGLIELIHEGRAEARKYELSTVRGEALMVVLMFAFGHGCTDDPLYPWISRTLKDERLSNPIARTKRLEKKAVTWLNHVLSWLNQGANA